MVRSPGVSERRAGPDLTGADEFLTVLVPIVSPAFACVSTAPAILELLPCLGASKILSADSQSETRRGGLSFALKSTAI